jgi:hypothetical protein
MHLLTLLAHIDTDFQ